MHNTESAFITEALPEKDICLKYIKFIYCMGVKRSPDVISIILYDTDGDAL